MSTLAILSGEMESAVFDLNKPVVTLGRRADNDVAVPLDPRISRFHAQLSQRGNEWVLEDLGSANGTFVGQRKIHGPTVIRPGDRFRMGRTWFGLVPETLPTSEAEARQNVRLLEPAELVAHAYPTAENVIYTVGLDQPRAQADEHQAQRWLDVMSQVSAALASTLHVGQLLDIIIQSIMTAIPADGGFVMLVDRQTGEFIPSAIHWRDPRMADTDITVSRHILEHALNQRAAIMTADAMTDERFEDLDSVQNLRLRSAICAPLMHGEETLGTIFLQSQSAAGVFTEQDVEMLRGIAGQAATAIENARLYTDLRQAFESLQSAQEKLVRSERLSTVGALSASIAHDMANVVTPLKPLLRLVTKDHNVDSEAYDSLARQMDRLTALLERVMSFAKPGDLNLQPLQVNEIVQRTISLIKSEIYHRKVEMVFNFDESLPAVMADAEQLDRVFLNLCLNALEAMETMPEDEQRVLTITSEKDGEEIAISFSDTGPGIPIETQERLFEPLFTTKATGTGLGLHSCKRIIEEEHHGTIEVDSLEGIGATFTVRLPSSGPLEPTAASADTATPEQAAPSG